MKPLPNSRQLLAWIAPLLNWRNLLKAACLALLIFAGGLVSEFLSGLLSMELRPSTEDRVHMIISLCALAYCALIAIPFVPGVEIGLAMIAMFGPPIVLLVYVSTVVGLSASFAVGHLLPDHVLINLLRSLGANRIADRVREISSIDSRGRLELLGAADGNRISRLALKNRYVLLAVAVNLPGSFLVGGGGGISMMAGASRLFSIHGFVVTIALAVSPIPLSVALFGMNV